MADDDDTLKDLRARLGAAIQFRNTNPKALAVKAGLGETVVRDIVKGHTSDVKYGTLSRLAAALDLSVVDLIGRLDVGQAPDLPPILSASREDGAIAVRHLDLSYAMGAGSELDDFPDEVPILFDPGFLRAVSRAPASRLFVAKGSGDSMFPTLVNGDQVLVDTTQRTINMQDRIWALSLHGASMIKRLRTIGSGRVRILSDNERVPPEEVDAADVHLVGRVIWIGRAV